MSAPESITVFKGSSSGRVVQETATPHDKILDNEVAIRMTYSGVCGTDLHYLKEPLVLGHEGVGVVESVGKEVTRFKPYV